MINRHEVDNSSYLECYSHCEISSKLELVEYFFSSELREITLCVCKILRKLIIYRLRHFFLLQDRLNSFLLESYSISATLNSCASLEPNFSRRYKCKGN